MTNLMTNQSNNKSEDFKANYLWNPEINEYVFSTIAASLLLERSVSNVRSYCDKLNIVLNYRQQADYKGWRQ